jgi:CRISPR-associated protein Cpf1
MRNKTIWAELNTEPYRVIRTVNARLEKEEIPTSIKWGNVAVIRKQNQLFLMMFPEDKHCDYKISQISRNGNCECYPVVWNHKLIKRVNFEEVEKFSEKKYIRLQEINLDDLDNFERTLVNYTFSKRNKGIMSYKVKASDGDIEIKVVKNNDCFVEADKFNESIVNFITLNRERMTYMGIDRGENNLLYVTIIDNLSNILLQKSLNVINGVNYQEIVKDQNPGAIREYCSAAIEEIIDLVLQYDSIILLEDLNNKVLTQSKLYKTFEDMLTRSLQYAFVPSRSSTDDGGVLNGYQLAPAGKRGNFSNKNQCGILFFVPPQWTSKIDPKTGFVNLFPNSLFREISSSLNGGDITLARDFLGKIDRISMAPNGTFDIEYDYKTFGINYGVKTHWVINSSLKSRVIHNNKRTWSTCSTNDLRKIFDQNRIYYADGRNIINDLVKTVNNVGFYKMFFLILSNILEMRYVANGEDYILSPVSDFDTREYVPGANMPENADANGAYNIARQGIRQLNAGVLGTVERDANKNWLKFAQQQ